MRFKHSAVADQSKRPLLRHLELLKFSIGSTLGSITTSSKAEGRFSVLNEAGIEQSRKIKGSKKKNSTSNPNRKLCQVYVTRKAMSPIQ